MRLLSESLGAAPSRRAICLRFPPARIVRSRRTRADARLRLQPKRRCERAGYHGPAPPSLGDFAKSTILTPVSYMREFGCSDWGGLGDVVAGRASIRISTHPRYAPLNRPAGGGRNRATPTRERRGIRCVRPPPTYAMRRKTSGPDPLTIDRPDITIGRLPCEYFEGRIARFRAIDY